MAVPAQLEELLAPVRADSANAGVLTDFDGTLSQIVEDPASARPVDGAVEVLAALTAHYRTIAVVSGRPAAFLRTVLPPALELVGIYGLERIRHGEVIDHPDVVSWRPVVDRATRAAIEELPSELLVEPKGVSVTVHWRTAPELGEVAERWVAQRIAVDGLVAHPGKMSLELKPPLAVDKGTTVRALCAGLKAVCFLGDDVGDIPAFEVLADLREAGVATASIAVRSAEVPPEVVAAADAAVDGPVGAVEVLRALLPGARA